MANYIAVDKAIHSSSRWKSPVSHAFASKETLVPLFAHELARAAMCFPIAFSEFGKGLQPAALLGLGDGRNLFVSGEGKWEGNYVPAVLRTYPFTMGEVEGGGKVLCFDQESGLVGGEGDLLLNPDGSLFPVLAKIVEMLNLMESDRPATLRACKALHDLGLIVPWEITVQADTGSLKMTGLHRIDEGAMNALDDADFLTLRRNGALVMAYCQLLSMQNLQILGRLSQAPKPVQDPLAYFLSQGETIRFSGLI